VNNLTKALQLASLGIPVCPWEVKPTGSGKHSKTPLTTHGFTDAVTDRAQIEAWWSEYPTAQVGYVPARRVAAPLMTLDVDPDAGGYTCLWNREETADTYDASRVFYLTPSGGEHRIYRLPADALEVGPNAPIPTMYGVDRRSGGGGAIWYGDVPTAEELNGVPVASDWMLRSKVPVVGGAYGGSTESWLDKHAGKAESPTVARAKERDMPGETAMNSLVVNLVRLGAEQHGGVPEALEYVRGRWIDQPHASGTPEQVLGEFERAMESAIRNLGEDDRDALWQLQEAVRLTEQSRVKVEPTPYEEQWSGQAPARIEQPEDGWLERDLSDVLNGTYVVPTPTILAREGDDPTFTFYPGTVNGIYGEPESGKTWIALQAVVEVLRDGGHVRYLDYESTPGTIVHRLLLLGADTEAMRTHFHYYKPDAAPTGDAYTKLLNSESTLIVLDGVTESFGSLNLDPNSNTDARAWHNTLPRPLSQLTGAAVVLIDHVSKTGGRSGFALGAQHKKAAMDGAVILVDVEEPLAPGRIGVLRMDIAKDREGALRAKSGPRKEGRLAPFAIFTLDSTDPRRARCSVTSWQSSKELARMASKTLDRKRELVEWLTTNGGTVASKNKLKTALEWHERDVAATLASLLQDGAVVEFAGPRGATGYRLAVVA
jgi:RecA/RadA recombinase